MKLWGVAKLLDQPIKCSDVVSWPCLVFLVVVKYVAGGGHDANCVFIDLFENDPGNSILGSKQNNKVDYLVDVRITTTATRGW